MSSDAIGTSARPIDDRTRPMRRGRPEASSAGSVSGDTIPGDEMIDQPSATAESLDPERASAAARLPSRIAFLGFGLIGGSIALALRESGSAANLTAWSPSGTGPAEGLRHGILDEAASSAAAAITGAELVILAAPPLAVVAAIDELVGPLAPALAADATITDVASTKGRVLQRARGNGLRFVGGHPMAGRETSGFGAAEARLFVDRPWVVVPSEAATPVDVDRVEALAAATGARPIRMTADEHDAAVASISHLPLVVAAALVESVAGPSVGGATWPLARRLAATGWSDMTRLAKGDPEMGAGILATNAGAVTASLKSLRETLDTWIELLEAQDAHTPELRGRLGAARAALQQEPDS
jgi:prephenate dehydrogenase